MESMAEAHERDYADEARLRVAQEQLDAFLKDPPRRAAPQTIAVLESARARLAADRAHIVAVWD